jgi:CheY-like chemotaxis protein
MPKLLIADGSPMMHRIMELTFAPEGLQVLTATDGEQAIALLPIARPDVVIADHALARRSGYEVAAFIREHGELGLDSGSAAGQSVRAAGSRPGRGGRRSRGDLKAIRPRQLVMRVRELLTRKPFAPVLHAVPAEQEPAPALKLVTPVAPPGNPPVRGALDDYFDRLDAALAKLDDQLTDRMEAASRRGDTPYVPTLDSVLGAPAAPVVAPALHDVVSVDSAQDSTSEPSRPSVEALVEAPSEIQQPAVTANAIDEALVEEVTRRVMERLAPGAVSDVVNDVVTRVAERLLREEIARLK